MASDGITGIVEELDALAASRGDVNAGEIMDRIGHRGTGVFLLVPGLAGLSPLGAVPTVPSLLALIVLIFSAQIALGRDTMWLPGVLKSREVDNDRLRKAADRLTGPARWLDRAFGRRLQALTGRIANRVAAVACIGLACLVPPMELLPFAAAVPLGAIAAFGLALVLRDGAVMLLAFAGSIGALFGTWAFLT